MKIKIPDMSILCKDNILTNSDFKSGIINQKGETSYENNDLRAFYTIDKWSISGKGKVIINDGYIRIESTSSEPFYFTQKLEKHFNEVCTLYTNVKNLSGDVGFAILGKNENNKTVKILKTGSILNTHTEAEGVTFVLTGISSYVEIHDVKLEKGQHFTGMPVWNGSEELNKCLRYFQKGYVGGTGWSNFKDSQSIFTVPIYPMVKKPSVSFTEKDSYKITDQSISAYDSRTLSVSYTKNNEVGGFRYGMYWEANAYDY